MKTAFCWIGIFILISIASIFGKDIAQYFSAEFFSNQTIAIPQEQLDSWVYELNKQFPTPYMVDKETKAISISSEEGQIIYKYSMINFTAQQLKNKDFMIKMKDKITNNFCNDKERVGYLQRGVSFVYMYYEKDQNLAGSFTIDKNACK